MGDSHDPGSGCAEFDPGAVDGARYRNPTPTVDTIILLPGGEVVLVKRKEAPYGWALPGGYVEEGESLEAAAVRESREETGLHVTLEEQFHTYSDPRRDPRRHNITTVFIGRARGAPVGGDDAELARAFGWNELPGHLAFDHAEILADVQRYLTTGARRKI